MGSEEMSTDVLKEELRQVEKALSSEITTEQREELLGLKANIMELLSLAGYEETSLNLTETAQNNVKNDNTIDEEYALFMSELTKEGALSSDKAEESLNTSASKSDISLELKSLEGMKCKAPHKHQWGDTVYHNAMVCSVVSTEVSCYDEIEVKVLFMNPTHQEMLTCPYLLESDCKFSDEKCRYSHGEIVAFSDLQEYIEPKFELLTIGSSVLAKQSNNLWQRALVKSVYNGKCLVKFESNQKTSELEFEHLLPLESSEAGESNDEIERESSDGEVVNNREDIINMCLLNSDGVNQALGDWEKYTKGIGSKLMEKMGYIVGSGLGRNSDGRVNPVTAVVLPAGKSLDHCMKLRENAGGDKNLFSAERKLKRLQRRQEIQNKKAYEREKKKVDVFNFLNETLSQEGTSKSSILTENKHREEIKKESCRSLNVASLKNDEDIKRVERDLFKIKDSMARHTDVNSQMHKNLLNQLNTRKNELDRLQTRAVNIRNEQNIRSDKKKLTIF